MTSTIEDRTREQLAAVLPVAIEKALASYETFLSDKSHTDAKTFKAHHDACKVAVSHLALLIKLAGVASGEEDSGQEERAALQTLLQEAREDVSGYKNTEND